MADCTSIMVARKLGFLMVSVFPLLGALLLLIDGLTLHLVSVQRNHAFISAIEHERLLNQVARWVDPLDATIIQCNNCLTCFDGANAQIESETRQLYVGRILDNDDWCIHLKNKKVTSGN